MNSTKSTSANANPVGSISTALAMVNADSQHLGEMIVNLHRRLDLVLRPDQTSPQSDAIQVGVAATPAAAAPLELEIYALNTQLRSYQTIIADILSRLEV